MSGTSEAMARRWVTSGRFKVKKEAVGIPPRTRLVRLSDVAAIRGRTRIRAKISQSALLFYPVPQECREIDLGTHMK